MLPKWSLIDIRERMFNRALMVTRERAENALGVLGPKLNIGSLFVVGDQNELKIDQLKSRAAAAKAQMDEMPGDGDLKKYMWSGDGMLVEKDPYEIWNGISIMPVRGTLMAENGIDPASGATGYDGLSFKARHALANPDVLGGILDIDSGGGEVVDLLELCSQLRAFASVKPLRAIIRGSACSAAYAIAACAGPGQITGASYSLAGSIGAIMLHADFSKQIADDGVDVTMITSAAHKADASQLKPLEPDVEERLQAMVDACASDFIDHVAAAREMDRSAIVAQQARFYSGQDTLDLGLIDKFMPWDESMKEFAQIVNAPTATTGGNGMAPTGARSVQKGTAMGTNTPAPAAEHQPDTTTQAAIDAARQEGHATGVTEGAQAERQRIVALAELDSASTLSAELTGAIEAGTSAGDFAIGLAKAQKAAQGQALADLKGEAVPAADVPKADQTAARGGVNPPVNRGLAAVERNRGKVPGLPAKTA